jgi:hypothetical protein
MALANRDRVLETSATVGTVAYTLAGAVAGFQSFAAVGDGNTCHYAAWEVDSNGNPSGGWECGLGTYTAAGTLLARSVVYASSNAGAAVDWPAGTRRIGISPQTNGTLVVRQPGGTPGIDEVQVSHDGTNVTISNMNDAVGTGRFNFTDAIGGLTNGITAGDVRVVNANRIRLNNVGLGLGNSDRVSWNSNGDGSGADTSLRRAAAAVVKVADGAGTGGGTLSSIPLTPAAISASQNNYNPGVARRYRLATDASGGKTITGLAISQVDGQECSIVNVSAADAITLTHQDAASTAANRFICTGAANIVLAVNEEALLWYDSTTTRWRARKI